MASIDLLSPTVAFAERPLDFVVLGIARSGTTAIGRTINLDPALFCATEYFSRRTDLDYRLLNFPETFFNAAYEASGPRNTETSRRILREKLARGPVIAFGNKLPSYTLQIDRLNEQLPRLRNLCIYRSPWGFCSSWDQRAANPKDKWGPGRTSFFALCEWMIILARLSEARHDIRIIDYQSLFFEDYSLAEQVLDYVGGRPPAAAIMDTFRATEFGGGTPATGHRRTMEELRHTAFLDRIGTGEFDAIIRRAQFFPAASLQATLRAFAESNLGCVFDYAAEGIASGGNAAELTFARRWAFITLGAFDNWESWTFGLLRPALVRFIERLAQVEPTLGLEDSHRFVDRLRRPGGDPIAAQRLRALLPARPAAPAQ